MLSLLNFCGMQVISITLLFSPIALHLRDERIITLLQHRKLSQISKTADTQGTQDHTYIQSSSMRLLHGRQYIVYNILVLPVIICLILKLLSGFIELKHNLPSITCLRNNKQKDGNEYLTAAWMATLSQGLNMG